VGHTEAKQQFTPFILDFALKQRHQWQIEAKRQRSEYFNLCFDLGDKGLATAREVLRLLPSVTQVLYWESEEQQQWIRI